MYAVTNEHTKNNRTGLPRTSLCVNIHICGISTCVGARFVRRRLNLLDAEYSDHYISACTPDGVDRCLPFIGDKHSNRSQNSSLAHRIRKHTHTHTHIQNLWSWPDFPSTDPLAPGNMAGFGGWLFPPQANNKLPTPKVPTPKEQLVQQGAERVSCSDTCEQCEYSQSHRGTCPSSRSRSPGHRHVRHDVHDEHSFEHSATSSQKTPSHTTRRRRIVVLRPKHLNHGGGTRVVSFTIGGHANSYTQM